jgi:hypothetical protein
MTNGITRYTGGSGLSGCWCGNGRDEKRQKEGLMKEYKPSFSQRKDGINEMKVVYDDDRNTDYPIGVQLYKDGELCFMTKASAVCLRDLLQNAILKDWSRREKEK